MNRDGAGQHLLWLERIKPVIAAFSLGRDVQYRFTDAPQGEKYWYDTPSPDFGRHYASFGGTREVEWRVKPEPVELEVWVCHTPHTTMPTWEDDATSHMQNVTVGQRSLNAPPWKYQQHWRKIKMQEVLK